MLLSHCVVATNISSVEHCISPSIIIHFSSLLLPHCCTNYYCLYLSHFFDIRIRHLRGIHSTEGTDDSETTERLVVVVLVLVMERGGVNEDER